MIDKNNFLSLNILKKEAYSGSMSGMRYRLEKKGEKPEELIRVTIWPEPLCYEKTKEELKQFQDFPFDEEGKNKIADWLNLQREEQNILWTR